MLPNILKETVRGINRYSAESVMGVLYAKVYIKR